MIEEMEKSVKIGIEIAFSNSHFDCLIIKDGKVKTNDKLVEFCKKIPSDDSETGKKQSGSKGDKKKKAKEEEVDPSEKYISFIHQEYIHGWKKIIEKKFKLVSTELVDDDPLKGFKKDKQKQLKVTNTVKGKSWSFNVDIDDCCIEIHADPLTVELYKTFKDVIENQIYAVAEELKLSAGYGGKGGGHLSVDLATGFDNKPLKVIKTVLMYELMQSEIDKCYGAIDVNDNSNAPYYFDSTREEFKDFAKAEVSVNSVLLLETCDLKLDKVKRNKLFFSKDNPGGDIRRWFIGALKQLGSDSSPDPLSRGWDNRLESLGKALMLATEAQKLRDDLKEMFSKDNFKNRMTRLHYQGINLEHSCIGTPEDQEDKKFVAERRVEFRRFVSQRNFYELVTAMKFLLKLIDEANATPKDFYLSYLKKQIFARIMTKDSMEKIRELAKKES